MSDGRRSLSLSKAKTIIIEEQMKIRGTPGKLADAQIAIYNRVRDEVGSEYAELLSIYDSMLMSNQLPHNKYQITISNSTINSMVLDSQVQSITASINSVTQEGELGANFALAVKQIVETIGATTELSNAQKKDALDAFQVVGQQAELPASQRKMAIVKPVLESIPKLLSSATALVSLWHSLGPQIAAFFQ